MSTSVLRRSLRRIPVLHRHVAASAPKGQQELPAENTLDSSEPKQHPPPSAKTRALISIYHQAGDFISPDNLSAAIDKAFLDDVETPASLYQGRETSLGTLQQQMLERWKLPKVGTGKEQIIDRRRNPMPGRWSDMKSHRELAVMGALYGTDGSAEPSLEVLEEEAARIQEHLRRDAYEENRQG
ncbi:hypothetical protein EW026_g4386 [Hermanssonia centrifuga]|uniref:Uncharacterized protein n=1 Tax=Hermanssonia centrifuga TaxID=98765 RepID=A0A4V6S0Y0_9APHY|nr:hypothetical protein EW026_g4386 [Hermanssonia centrifuga]